MANPAPRVHFWFGNDDFTKAELLRAEKEALRAQNPNADIQDFDFLDVDSRLEMEGRIENALRGSSLFSPEKLVVIRNYYASQRKSHRQAPVSDEAESASGKKSGLEDFLLQQLDRLGAGDRLYLWEARPLNKSTRLSKKLETMFKAGEALRQEFTLPVGFKLDVWLEERSRRLGGMIGKPELDHLATLLGKGMEQKERGEVVAAYDLYQAAGELDKLIAYANGRPITRADIDLLVSVSYDMNIFALIGCIARRDKARALTLLSGQIEQGFNENYILTMLVFHFRSLITVKSLLGRGLGPEEIALVAHLNPWVAQESARTARGLREEDLVRVYEKLYGADLSIKTGKLEPELALDILLAAI